jgi:hypothetical protein
MGNNRGTPGNQGGPKKKLPLPTNALPPKAEPLGINGSLAVILTVFPFGYQHLGLPNSPIIGLACWIVGLCLVWRLGWIVTEGKISKNYRHAVSAFITLTVALTLWVPVSQQITKITPKTASVTKPPKTAAKDCSNDGGFHSIFQS